MRSLLKFLGIIFFLASLIKSTPGISAILIEDNGKKITNNVYSSYQSVSHFKKNHRVGVGFGLSGVHGLFGLHLDLGFSPKFSTFIGYGAAPNLTSFSFGIKRYYDGKSVSPYLALLATNWYGSIDPLKTSDMTPNWYSKIVQPNSSTNQYSSFFIVPATGIKYFQLNGSTKGLSLFAEIDFFIDSKNWQVFPSGMLGTEFLF